MSNIAILIVAKKEADFKKYLIACEYLQIEPAKVYELDYIKNRIEIVRSHWNELDKVEEIKKLNQSLDWLEKNYVRVTKKDFSTYGFAKECDILAQKGELIIHEGSINETYVKCELSQKNHDFYSRNDERNGLIAIGVVLVFVLIIIALFLL